MSDQTYIVEPRDPLIARDGRPFQNSPGARARTLPFLLPTTLAGAIRTQAGLVNGQFDPSKAATVLRYSLRGPILVKLSDQGTSAEWFAPAPLDALMLDGTKLFALSPFELDAAALSDLGKEMAPPPEPCPATDGKSTEYLVGRLDLPKGKPQGMPNFWRWEKFKQWLLEAKDKVTQPEVLGIAGPAVEYRTHVRIDPDTQMAQEGALFQTSGLEFSHVPSRIPLAGASSAPAGSGPVYRSMPGYKRMGESQRLALLFSTDAANQAARLGSLGGERRLMFWRGSSEDFEQAGLRDEIINKIIEAVTGDELNKGTFYCRVILLTPAYFEKGHLPTWLVEKRHEVTPELIAVACGRPVVVSGWDYAANSGKGHPKPTRRLAPAGSVYFLKLSGTKDAVKEWIVNIWMQNVSDDDQSRRDGLGLAVVGTWKGLEGSHA